VVSGLIQNAIRTVEANLISKESNAQATAVSAYAQGEAIPGIGFILGPVYAAAAFAGASAYATGTDMVPGIGLGDSVPAVLTPGEGVVPGGVMDGLRAMARSGSMGGGTHYHAHVSPTYNLQALDASGMDKVLDKHGPTLQKHVESVFRKLNR
jgi:hypothetical protein